MIDQAVAELVPVTGTRVACATVGAAQASWYRRCRASPAPARPEPIPHRERPQPRALAPVERQAILDVLHSDRFADAAPAEVWATLLDEGTYLGSVSTFYRVLREQGEVRERRRQATHPAAVKPELMATVPNQVWSWDITKLHGPATWTYYYLYVILDIFSRYVTGWMVATGESAALAERLISDTCAKQQVSVGQLTIHADRGSSMTSKPVAFLLADLGITQSHSRPHVSNDNPFSESQFKTFKYRPAFPGQFGSIQDARAHRQVFFPWYNNDHRHSALGLHTPADVHYGRAQAVHAARADVLAAAYAVHPERFASRPPALPKLPVASWINRPQPQDAGPPSTAIVTEEPALPSVTLDAGDAAELAEMLPFLGRWLARDPGRLGASLEEFVGNPGYGIHHLRDDLDRFIFLLGGSDGNPFLTKRAGPEGAALAPPWQLKTGPWSRVLPTFACGAHGRAAGSFGRRCRSRAAHGLAREGSLPGRNRLRARRMSVVAGGGGESLMPDRPDIESLERANDIPGLTAALGYREYHAERVSMPFQEHGYRKEVTEAGGEIRERAVRALVRIGSPAVRALAIACGSHDAEVVYKAREALSEIGADPVGPLAAALEDEDRMTRAAAVRAWGIFGDGPGPLFAALKDEDGEVRCAAVETLGRTGDARAVEPLIGARSDEDSSVRLAAVPALEALGDARAAESLAAALNDPDQRARLPAAKALVELGDTRAVRPLAAVLQAGPKVFSTRSLLEAVALLRKIGAPAATALGRAFRHDMPQQVREDAVAALAAIGGPRAIKPLAIATEWNQPPQVRFRAVEALAAIGGPRTAGPLIDVLRGADHGIESQAVSALERIGLRAVKPLAEALTSYSAYSPGGAAAVAEALGAIGDARAVDPLITALTAKDSRVRAAAAAALGAIGDARALDPLITALTDQDKQVRAAAARGLGSIKDARAIGPLISALHDDDPRVWHVDDPAWDVRNALAQFGASAVERLIAALGSKDWTIRRGAAETLGLIRDTRAIEPLTAAARARRIGIHKDRYTAVRQAAADALFLTGGHDHPGEGGPTTTDQPAQ